MGKDGKLSLESAAKAPEIYRMTPYEFALTAEPVQQIIACARPIPVQSSVISTSIRTGIHALPASLIGANERSA